MSFIRACFSAQIAVIPPIHIIPKNHKHKIINIYKRFFWVISTFHEYFFMPNCLKILILSLLLTTWLTQFFVITNQLIYFWRSLYYLQYPNFTVKFKPWTSTNVTLLFITQKRFYFFLLFFTCTNPSILLDAMLQALIICLFLF